MKEIIFQNIIAKINHTQTMMLKPGCRYMNYQPSPCNNIQEEQLESAESLIENYIRNLHKYMKTLAC